MTTFDTLLPLLTSLVGVGGTLGGVALTQRSSNKRERERAQQARVDSRSSLVRESMTSVLAIVGDERIYVDRSRKVLAGDAWDAAYETHVYDELLSPLSRAIALVPNADARSQLSLMPRAITSGLKVNGGNGELYFFIDVILNTASDVSSAYARGEEPDSRNLRQLDRVLAWVHQTEKDTQATFSWGGKPRTTTTL